jgi:hypothetical protein
VDTRLTYLLTLLPPLPPIGETPPITLAEALNLLRQQGGTDLEQLTELLEAESLLREALDEWIVNPPGSRVVPRALPQPLRSLFDDELVAGMTEEAWVGSVRHAYLDLLSEAGHRLGSSLLSRWSAWEGSLRLNLARQRARLRGDRDEPVQELSSDVDPGMEAALAAWSAARSRGGDAERLGAAMEAEVSLDVARLAFLTRESPRYSFTMDELVAYLLQLRLLERHQHLDPQRGRALLREVAAL